MFFNIPFKTILLIIKKNSFLQFLLAKFRLNLAMQANKDLILYQNEADNICGKLEEDTIKIKCFICDI